MKKRLSQNEEFQIMKLVLDKFLWLGFGIMAFGLYKLITGGADAVVNGFAFIFGGAVILVLFLIIVIKEYEFIR
jgi:hypothetical protein